MLAARTRPSRLSAAELAAAIEDYGRTLTPVLPNSLDDLDIVELEDAETPTYHVVVELWTEEEGRSDLTLELLLTDRYGGAYDIEIRNLHVL